MKKLYTLLLLLVVASSYTFGQWGVAKSWPDTVTYKKGSGVHGIAVDPYGRVWIQPYGATDSLGTGLTKKTIAAVYVYNADGTQTSFSPIRMLTVNGVTDTFGLGNSGRGIRADKDGNILFAYFNMVFRVNYKTGAGMAKLLTAPPAAAGTAPAVDGVGNTFTAFVVAGTGHPVQMWDANFNSLGNALDSTAGFARTFNVSADGNTLYWTGYTNHAVIKYGRADEFSPFLVKDTILKGFDCESVTWGTTASKKWLYFSSGSLADSPNRYPGTTTYHSVATWYGYDMATNTKKDSLKWSFWYADSVNQKPRALGFSPTGDTAYISCFGSSSYPAVQRVIRPTSSIKDMNTLVSNYSLEQNYPNPFNPSTTIRFALPVSGYTTLKVYDVLGNEVATLVNKNVQRGVYEESFDASKLASGTYIYQLVSGDVRITNKMLLLK